VTRRSPTEAQQRALYRSRRRPSHLARLARLVRRTRFAAVSLAALTAITALAAPAAADPLPRAAYVARALAAVRGLGPAGCEALDRAIYAAARTQCRADSSTPATSCLISAGRAACATAADRPRCEAAADIIAANLRGQSAWVDDATRMRLVRGSADYRAALTAELRRRYAVLAAELVLAGPGAAAGDDARGIDELCLRRDRVVHACEPGDKACIPSLPWSRCVAALVWFVGGGP
jgi:hypothetical protein